MASAADADAYDENCDADDESELCMNFMTQRAGLDRGPENLVFVPAANSPTCMPLLLAAHPRAARLAVYTVEQGSMRQDDGSCPQADGCWFLDKKLTPGFDFEGSSPSATCAAKGPFSDGCARKSQHRALHGLAR